jgi:hypothetical protein
MVRRVPGVRATPGASAAALASIGQACEENADT